MSIEIRFVSAPWCNACSKIKEPFISHCACLEIIPGFLDYDSLDEEFQASIKSLPTILVRKEGGQGWTYYTAVEFETWKMDTILLNLKKTEDF